MNRKKKLDEKLADYVELAEDEVVLELEGDEFDEDEEILLDFDFDFDEK